MELETLVVNQRNVNRIFPLFSFSFSLHSQPRVPLNHHPPESLTISFLSFHPVQLFITPKIPSRTNFSHPVNPVPSNYNACDACFNHQKKNTILLLPEPSLSPFSVACVKELGLGTGRRSAGPQGSTPRLSRGHSTNRSGKTEQRSLSWNPRPNTILGYSQTLSFYLCVISCFIDFVLC